MTRLDAKRQSEKLAKTFEELSHQKENVNDSNLIKQMIICER